MSRGRSVQQRGTAFTLLTLPLYGPNFKWGVSVIFIANALTLHVPVLRYTVRTCTYAYSAGDTNSYAVHGME